MYVFLVFGGVLNILPFRVKDISDSVNEFQISLLYVGYGMGIIVSLGSKKIVKFFKNELNTIVISILFFLFILIFLVVEDIVYLFILLFLFCIGMFTVHTVSTGPKFYEIKIFNIRNLSYILLFRWSYRFIFSFNNI